MEVELNAIPVMYVISPNGPQGAGDAFKKLEDAIDWNLRGRKFYGAMFKDESEYRACLAIIDEKEPEILGFKTWIIPGGKYYKETIPDWEKHTAEIAPKCEEIIKKVAFDKTRPIIEFYRSQAELFLFIPVK